MCLSQRYLPLFAYTRVEALLKGQARCLKTATYVDAPSSNEFGEEDSDSIAPTETFEKLLTPDTVAHILTETNRYGEQYTDELKVFFHTTISIIRG